MILKMNKLCILPLRQYCSSKNFDSTQILSTRSRENFISKFTDAKVNINLNRDAKISKYSAVLVPVIRVNDELSLLYTLRSIKLKSHRRQVSFPGGNRDEADKTYIDCALRETEEEIGLNRKYIDVWSIGPLLTTSNNSSVIPVVGVVSDANIGFKINHDEVEKIFTVPIRHLCAPENCGYTQFRTGYSIPVFLNGEEKIWGITAVITHLFLKSLLPKELYANEIKFIPRYKQKTS